MGKRKNNNIVHKDDFNFKGGELFARMNYLFKVSNWIYDKREGNGLSKAFIGMMKEISKRNALKIDKKIKKLICEQCNNLMFKDIDTGVNVTNICGKVTMNICCGKCKWKTKLILF
jgi:RNase P subunit RPR2